MTRSDCGTENNRGGSSVADVAPAELGVPVLRRGQRAHGAILRRVRDTPRRRGGAGYPSRAPDRCIDRDPGIGG